MTDLFFKSARGRKRGRAATIISLPLPDGTVGRYRIVQTPLMAPALAAKFPEIKTFSGQGIDNPASTVRLDWTPHGFHAMILSASGSIFIDPYSRNDIIHYISYYTRDHIHRKVRDFFEYPPVDPYGTTSKEIRRLLASALQKPWAPGCAPTA